MFWHGVVFSKCTYNKFSFHSLKIVNIPFYCFMKCVCIVQSVISKFLKTSLKRNMFHVTISYSYCMGLLRCLNHPVVLISWVTFLKITLKFRFQSFLIFYSKFDKRHLLFYWGSYEISLTEHICCYTRRIVPCEIFMSSRSR